MALMEERWRSLVSQSRTRFAAAVTRSSSVASSSTSETSRQWAPSHLLVRVDGVVVQAVKQRSDARAVHHRLVGGLAEQVAAGEPPDAGSSEPSSHCTAGEGMV